MRADPDLIDVGDATTAQEIEALTAGKVEATVLNAFLDNQRDDLPPEYLPLLCGVKSLGLTRLDYKEQLPPTPKRYTLTPAQTTAKMLTNSVWNEHLKRNPVSRGTYVSLSCRDADAMKKSFKDRLERAGVSHAEIGRRFGLSMVNNGSKCIEIANFFGPDANTALCGPVFGHKLQEQFWEICAFLNEELHRNDPAHPVLTTEQFIVEMLKEGTVIDPKEKAAKLKKLSDLVNHTSPPGNSKE